jgi:hypothetical protein
VELDFKDISSEKYRVYEFPGGDQIRIHQPQLLNVSASGGHRITDSAGISHYIPKGWIHLYWQVKEGQPEFSF